MSKKKGESPSSTTVQAPRMISVRDFVRGGYQHVDEPVLVMSQSRALFAAYPVETSSDYLSSQPLAAMAPSHADPAWLGRGIMKGALTSASASVSRVAPASPPAPARPLRRKSPIIHSRDSNGAKPQTGDQDGQED